MEITPESGSVGEIVLIQGTKCNNPGQDFVALSFEGEPTVTTGTVGSDDLPRISVSQDGSFSYHFTIPSQLDTIQGEGGGSVKPGIYELVSLPVICQQKFTVTG